MNAEWECVFYCYHPLSIIVYDYESSLRITNKTNAKKLNIITTESL